MCSGPYWAYKLLRERPYSQLFSLTHPTSSHILTAISFSHILTLKCYCNSKFYDLDKFHLVLGRCRVPCCMYYLISCESRGRYNSIPYRWGKWGWEGSGRLPKAQPWLRSWAQTWTGLRAHALYQDQGIQVIHKPCGNLVECSHK